MKKYIALFLIFTLALSLCSCSLITVNRGDDTTAVTEDTTDPSVLPDGFTEVRPDTRAKKAQAQAYLDSVGDCDFAAGLFTLATTPDFSFAPSTLTNAYEQALAERNDMVEEKFGIELVEFETPLELLLTDSYSAYLSGLYYADAMVIPASSLGAFAAKGHLLNIYSLPFISYDRDYFDLGTMEQTAAGYGAYAVSGAFTRDIGSYYCIYVNTELLGTLGLELPEAKVRDGSWTWDALLELSAAATDINGDIYTIGAGDYSALVSAVYKSTGLDYMNTGFGRIPSVGFDNERTDKAVSVIRSLIWDGKPIYDTDAPAGSAAAQFATGSLLFAAAPVDEMADFAAVGRGWTILPIPKADAAQEDYIAYCSPDAPLLVTSAGNLYPESTAYAIEALNAASYSFLDDAYYDHLTVTGANSSFTLGMLDYVCGIKSGTTRLDFVDLYADQYPELRTNTVETIKEMVSDPAKTRADAAYWSAFDLNWRMVNAFPVA